ncbi:hypothetical protein Bca101_027193 [Brassica carinata]
MEVRGVRICLSRLRSGIQSARSVGCLRFSLLLGVLAVETSSSILKVKFLNFYAPRLSSSTFDFSILQCYLLVSSLTDLCCLFMRLLGVFSVSAVRSVIGGLSTFVMKFSLVIRATTWEVLRSFLVNDVLHFFSVATCFGYHHPSVSVGRLINFDRLALAFGKKDSTQVRIFLTQSPSFQALHSLQQVDIGCEHDA